MTQFIDMREEGLHEIDGLVFQFCTTNTVYYKNDHMYDLDETLGDVHSMIVGK